MSQGEEGKDTKEKKKVPGWSIEEIKERPNIAVEEDREEMKRWRSLNQCEMDPCWKNWVERIEEEVLDKYKVEKKRERAFKGLGMEKSAQVQEVQNYKVVRRLLGNNFLFV